MKRGEIFILDGEELSNIQQSLFDLESIFQEISRGKRMILKTKEPNTIS